MYLAFDDLSMCPVLYLESAHFLCAWGSCHNFLYVAFGDVISSNMCFCMQPQPIHPGLKASALALCIPLPGQAGKGRSYKHEPLLHMQLLAVADSLQWGSLSCLFHSPSPSCAPHVHGVI